MRRVNARQLSVEVRKALSPFPAGQEIDIILHLDTVGQQEYLIVLAAGQHEFAIYRSDAHECIRTCLEALGFQATRIEAAIRHIIGCLEKGQGVGLYTVIGSGRVQMNAVPLPPAQRFEAIDVPWQDGPTPN